MATRVVRLQEADAEHSRWPRRIVDPAGTTLMVAISGTVLAATLAVASMSIGAGGRDMSVAPRPNPAPPPTLAAPESGAEPVSP